MQKGTALRLAPGLSRKKIEEISWIKSEPAWMRQRRLASYEIFRKTLLPAWGPDLSGLNLDKISYYQKNTPGKYGSWQQVPFEIRQAFEKIGVPKAERKLLAGVVGQYDSEGVYEKLKKTWEKKGVIFCDTDTALQKYPDLVREYFMTRCVAASDNKFAALHGAVWSGGSFVFVPAGVSVTLPVHAYYRIAASGLGQFEHTLIIVESGADLHYIEGCTAPMYNATSLHSAVVEIFVEKGGHCQYSTVQNWSRDVYNLNTKRALIEESGFMEWVSGSLGSKVSMLYPASVLSGRAAKASHLNISLAGPGQIKDTGAKVIHAAPDTSSTIVSKSISYDGGQNNFRGLIKVLPGAKGAKAHMQCDSLLSGRKSVASAVPKIKVFEKEASVGHEAHIGRISEEQVFYLMTRGLSEKQATGLLVQGFAEPVVKKLPLEYAVELNRLLAMEMEESVG